VTDCLHHELMATASLNHMTRDGEILCTVAEFSVFCKDCRMPFKFEWNEVADPQVLPLGIDLMTQRPWVTPFRETLCATVTPHPEGDFYGQHHQTGNA
jgi:hypothetical protein